MLASNKAVKSMWVGDKLGRLEQLTIRSFIDNGHEFHLWSYAKNLTGVPAGTVVHDAGEILSPEKVFHYPDDPNLTWGRGSFAGFSDIFRYKLLYEQGGWWVDMDVTCLKPFDFPEDYFFRDHWKLDVVGNVLKCPPKSQLMADCLAEAIETVDATNTDWHKPIQILNDHIHKHSLMKFRKEGLFTNDRGELLTPYFESDIPPDPKWFGIHWVNSAGDRPYADGSTYHQLLLQHGVVQKGVA